MTAINNLAEAAGSMRCAGGLVPLDLAMAGIRMPISLLYESLPRSLIDLKSDKLLAINIAHASDRDIQVKQAPSIDIYSLLDEVRRTVSGMQERTANIPDIYAHYAYPAALASPLVPSNMPDLPAESRPDRADGTKREQYRTPSADVESKAHQKVAEKESQIDETTDYAFEQDIGHSNLIIQQLRDDSAVLAWNIAEVERMVDEAIRLSYGGGVSNAAYMEPHREAAVDVEKARATRPEARMPQAQDMTAGVRKYPATTSKEAPASTPAARSLAEGVGLLNMVYRSTPDIIVLQAAMARDVSESMAMEAIQPSAEPGFTEVRYVPSEASGVGNAGSSADEPDLVAPRVAATVSPVLRAMDVTKIFNGLIRSYLVARGTAPGRHAMKEGITQLLLSLPGPQMPESPAPELFSVAARLQDARPTVTEAPIADDTSTLLGDLRELRGTMATLQAAVGSLRLPVAGTTGSQETAGTTEIPVGPSLTDKDIIVGNVAAEGQPDQEWISGELLSVQGSIARLQAAFNYLRVNVPTLADFVVLQKFIQDAPMEQAATVTQALPAGIAIEGVQPKSAPVPLPDYSWVTREFLQMQGMVARLQVPMYAEGGLVEQPTLAFVGESEPEWIVPMSTWDASQTKLKELYSMLWSQVQDLGTAMKDTVDGVNDAISSVQGSGSGSEDSGSEEEDSGDAKEYQVNYLDQLNDIIERLFDPYLKQLNLSVSDMKGSFTSTSKAGLITAGSGIATLYGADKLKSYVLGDGEEKDASGDSGGDSEEKEESDDSDEEDFWELIEGLGAAGSISDKRNGKFGDSDE